MKNTIATALIIIMCGIMSACSNKEKAPENQPVDAVIESSNQQTEAAQPADAGSAVMTDSNSTSMEQQKATPVAQGEENKTKTTGSSQPAKDGSTLTGQQTVESMSNRMAEKLSLSNDQLTQLQTILTKGFVEGAYDLNSYYTMEQSRTILKNIFVSSKAQIEQMLNDDQKTHFNKWLSKQTAH